MCIAVAGLFRWMQQTCLCSSPVYLEEVVCVCGKLNKMQMMFTAVASMNTTCQVEEVLQ